MREIKFRVWDKRKGRMRFGNDNLLINLGGLLFWDVGYKEPDMLGEEERQDYELMQYAGLKDKNGVEYYEKDIYKYDNPNSGYGDPNQPDYLYAVINSIEDFWDDEYLKGRLECSENVGNIYENPELVYG